MALLNDHAHKQTIEVNLITHMGIASVLEKLEKQQHQSIDRMFHNLVGLAEKHRAGKIRKKALEEVLNMCKEQLQEHITFDIDLARRFLDRWREESVKTAEGADQPKIEKPN